MHFKAFETTRAHKKKNEMELNSFWKMDLSSSNSNNRNHNSHSHYKHLK